MSLMNLSQIKGGKKLQSDVQALLTSYDAAKVLTKIAKGADAAAGTYNVEELLTELRTNLAAITGTATGSTATVSDLDTAVKALQGKKVKDVVRMEFAVAEGKATIPADIDTKVPGLDKTVKLPVYTVDNDVLFNEKGEQLVVDLSTGAFNGTPSVLDEDASAAKTDGSFVYKAATVDKVKAFPTGEWKLSDLPSDALLDNDEIQLIAYKKAINKIIVELAKDKGIIDAVKTQIGTKAVQDQLNDATAALQTKIDAKADTTDVYSVDDKGVKTPLFRKTSDALKMEDLDTDLQDVIKTAAIPNVFDPSSLIAEDAKKLDKSNVVASTVDTKAAGYVPSDDKVLSEKAVLAALANVGDAVEHVKDKIAVTAEASVPVTEFALSKTPTDDKVVLYINHCPYFEGDDFTVDRAAKKATWTLTEANEGFNIDKDLTNAVYFVYDAKKA